jgi:hypothetical protein
VVFGGVVLFLGSLFALNVGFYLPIFFLGIWIAGKHRKRASKPAALFAFPIVGGWVVLTVCRFILSGGFSSAYDIRGTGELILGSLFSPARVLRSASGLVNGFVLTDLGTLMRLGLTDPRIPEFAREFWRFALACVPTLLLLAGACVLLWKVKPRLGQFLWLVMVVTGVFGYLWLGSDPQFWLPVVNLAPLAFAAIFSRLGTVMRRVFLGFMLLLGLLLCVVNYKGRTPCLLSPRGGASWQLAERVSEVLPTDLPVIVFAPDWASYLQYLLGDRYIYGMHWVWDMKKQTSAGGFSMDEITETKPAAFILPTQRLELERLDQRFQYMGLPGLLPDLQDCLEEKGYKITHFEGADLYLPPARQE